MMFVGKGSGRLAGSSVVHVGDGGSAALYGRDRRGGV